MKKQLYTKLAMVLVATGLVISAEAQCTPSEANIPFQFDTGMKTLPAGHYRIECATPQGPNALSIRGDKESSGLMTIPVTGTEKDNWRLVFHRYGDRYFLAQIWMEPKTGVAVPQSSAERDVKRESASANLKTVALSRND